MARKIVNLGSPEFRQRQTHEPNLHPHALAYAKRKGLDHFFQFKIEAERLPRVPANGIFFKKGNERDQCGRMRFIYISISGFAFEFTEHPHNLVYRRLNPEILTEFHVDALRGRISAASERALRGMAGPQKESKVEVNPNLPAITLREKNKLIKEGITHLFMLKPRGIKSYPARYLTWKNNILVPMDTFMRETTNLGEKMPVKQGPRTRSFSRRNMENARWQPTVKTLYAITLEGMMGDISDRHLHGVEIPMKFLEKYRLEEFPEKYPEEPHLNHRMTLDADERRGFPNPIHPDNGDEETHEKDGSQFPSRPFSPPKSRGPITTFRLQIPDEIQLAINQKAEAERPEAKKTEAEKRGLEVTWRTQAAAEREKYKHYYAFAKKSTPSAQEGIPENGVFFLEKEGKRGLSKFIYYGDDGTRKTFKMDVRHMNQYGIDELLNPRKPAPSIDQLL